MDATLGLGGHALRLFQAGGEGLRIIGIDRDARALQLAQQKLHRYRSRMSYIQGNFADIERHLGDQRVDGFLADLGLSSMQIEDSQRGFSYLEDGPLDMAMDPQAPSLKRILATASEADLARVLKTYGEEGKARSIAKEIVRVRAREEITRTAQLRSIVERVVSPHKLIGSLSRVFQALRIFINRELENLENFLPPAVKLLNPGGRLVLLSYHSLEDRIIKRFFKREEKGCTCPPDFPQCVCGNTPTLRIITRRPVLPTPQEVEENSRSRSAKLRAAERLYYES